MVVIKKGILLKKVVIYANCQSAAIGKMLNENEIFSHNYEWCIIPPVQNIKSKKQIEYLIKIVRDTDVFIYQHVNNKHFPNETKTEYLLTLLKKNAIKISFPSLYFNGYFPHLGTMKGKTGPLNLVHDYNIVYCFIKDLSVVQIQELINKSDFYPKEISIKLSEESIKELALRENNTDIKVSSFIKNNYKKERLFNQFNHPRRLVFEFVAKEILGRLGILHADFSSSKEYIKGVFSPIYPSIMSNLELNFSEVNALYSNGAESLTQEEVINKFFDLYKTMDKEVLMQMVKEIKPFVIHLIDK